MERVVKHLRQEKQKLENKIDEWESRISNNQNEIDGWQRSIDNAKENISQIELSILQLQNNNG